MTPRLTYTAFMLAAFAVFLLTRRLMPQPPGYAKLSTREKLTLGLSAFVGGAFGAKLPFLFEPGGPWYANWVADGKTITTGLIGAYLAVEFAKLILGIRVKTGDAFALPLALALAVGRWGCYFNGCCHGTPTDLAWGVDFGDGVRRHPTQIFESLFHLTMAFVLLTLIARDWLRTHRLQLYLIAYGVYRFATEFIRPEPVYAAGLTYYQWATILMIVALAAQWSTERYAELGVQPREFPG